MLGRNLFDEAARVLAMPVPRRKALKHVAVGFGGALVSFLWPKRAMACVGLTWFTVARRCKGTATVPGNCLETQERTRKGGARGPALPQGRNGFLHQPAGWDRR